DLEPARQEDEEAPPGTQDRPCPDSLAAFECRAEYREVQRDPADPEPGSRLDGLDNHEVIEPWLSGTVPAHQVEREPVAAPRHEVQQRPERAVLGSCSDHAALVTLAADPAER